MSDPSLVQTKKSPTSEGNFYLVFLDTFAKMQMFWRDKSRASTGHPWQKAETFGFGYGATPPVMIQGNSGADDETKEGNFELLVVRDGRVEHWSRLNTLLNDEVPGIVNNRWNHLATFGTGIKHAWGLLQGGFGGNQEAMVERENGEMQH